MTRDAGITRDCEMIDRSIRLVINDFMPFGIQMKCSDCGSVTMRPDATKCRNCGRSFVLKGVEVLQSGAEPNSREIDPATDTSGPDSSNWFVSLVHRRAKGGVLLGIVLVTVGAISGARTRGDVTLAGGSLIATGVTVLILSVLLAFATRTRKA